MKSGYVSHQGIPVGNGTFVSLEGLLYDSPLSPISQSRYGHEQFPFSNVSRSGGRVTGRSSSRPAPKTGGN
ncbi:MAG: hypothetical protein V8S69_00935 [Dakarella massiliensis]